MHRRNRQGGNTLRIFREVGEMRFDCPGSRPKRLISNSQLSDSISEIHQDFFVHTRVELPYLQTHTRIMNRHTLSSLQPRLIPIP